jgi:putative ABC transport system permease protein
MTLFRDVRLALRQLASVPGYTVAALLTLGLGIGATSAVFSAVNGVLLRPMPVTQADDLVVTWHTDKARSLGVIELTHKQFRESAAETAIFSQAAAMGSHNWPAILEGQGDPAKIWLAGVSASFFDTLGLRPARGRVFRAEEDVHNGPAVAVMSHATWVRRFGADAAIVGRTVQLSGRSTEVLGVMPASFEFPRGAEFWTPVTPVLAGSGPTPNTNVLDNVGLLYVVGRLRPGLDAAAAARGLDGLIRRQAQAAGVTGPRASDIAVVTPFVEHVFGPVRPALWALAAAVGVLLLIACANVSGLMITRVTLRRREHAVRLALGATPGSVGRLWAVEILLLAGAGALLGLGAAHVLVAAMVTLAPDDVPGLAEIVVNRTVVLFASAICLVAAGLAGVMPVRMARASTLVDMLVDGGRTTAGRHSLRARSALLVLQVSLAVVLLVAAGLVVRSYTNLTRVNLGFESDRVLSLTVEPRTSATPPNVWMSQLLERIEALPGVEAAGAVYLRPLQLGAIGQGVLVRMDGQAATRAAMEQNPILNHQIATPGYFRAMRIPLVQGRLFADSDHSQAPRVAIVSAATAARLWPGRNAIGQRMGMSSFIPGVQGPQWRTVVGVVADVRYRGLNDVLLDVYDPALQVGRPATSVAVRAAGDPLALAGAIQAEARALDAGVIVDGVTTLDAVVRRATAPWRLSAWMFLIFGGLAFGLSAVGLFSLVTLDVANRRRELAVRLALGASRRSILRLVLTGAAWRVAAGVAAGLAVAVGVTRAVRSLLFQVTPVDPSTYAGVVALVAGVVTIAALLPALRAARIDPIGVLKRD